jgi:tRNA A-37 threonylcarbamoyl transferase component Bud32
MSASPVPSNKAGAPAATPPGAASRTPITRVSSSLQDKMIGRTVGKCRLLKRLGRGGMGDVYLGTHAEMNKTVAIKILPPDLTRNEELLQRFRREAESAARLEHPNLVEVYDIGEENNLHFIVMAYVEGMNLQELLDDAKKLEPREAARIAFEVCRGLQAVHADGIVHRDIKPANILISSKGEVKIVDFGLAFDAEDKTTLTVAGAVMGTPWYLAPEQAEGKRADPRSDLYSLGVCLYLLVTGVRPFSGETHMSVLYKQIHEKPKDPRLYVPDLPDYLAEVILKALEKKPEKRFQDVMEFARALEAFLKGTYSRKAAAPAPDPVAATPPVPAAPPKPGSAFLAFAVAFLVALAGAAACVFLFAGRAPDAAHDDLVKQAALAEAKGDFASARGLYQEATRLRDTAETRDGLARLDAKPKPETAAPPAPTDPALFRGILSDTDRRQVADRDYAPVLKRLPSKGAPSKAAAKLATALRVVSQYRTVVAAERQPALRLRDGRVTSYAFTPLSAVHAETIVEYARKGRDITELDLAHFLLVDGEARLALDHVILGRDIRPECRPALDDLVETALAQTRDAREIAERLTTVREKLGASAAKVDAALRATK